MSAIDRVNSEDPNRLVIEGVERPKEVVHAEHMSGWVEALDPAADEAQLLAARAHHLKRWALPRSEYPEGRSGYLRWRTALKSRHAEDVGAILEECGYGLTDVERVKRIVRKEGLATDPAVQTHEDALCLTFLEMQLGELAERLGEDRTVEVVRKSIAKMSPSGREKALGLDLAAPERAIVERALAPG